MGGRREALLEEVDEAEGGGRHAIDDEGASVIVAADVDERGAARAAVRRAADFRWAAEALRSVAGAEQQLRDRIPGV